MSTDDFRQSPVGRLVPTIQGCQAFVPHPLPPPALDLTGLISLLARATHALGELSGIGRTLPNPSLLIRPFTRLEAVASSKIEGTVTTFSELFIFEVDTDSAHTRADTREVHNYTRALQYGLQRLQNLPISTRLISEIHAVLMKDVEPSRGLQFRPGEFKSDQNWIGARLIQNARFIPPPPYEATIALSDLEKYIHTSDNDLPLIIKLALIHYQFEAIHPFPDGNGRIGRLLIPLILCEQGAMSQPLLYLSPYFERNYNEYIDRLYEVSTLGRWEEWIKFFLTGVEQSCRSAIARAHALQDLHRTYRQKIEAARSSALLGRLIDALFDIPAVNIPFAARHLGITYHAAQNNIQRLVDLGILHEHERKRPKWYFADGIIAVAYYEEESEAALAR
jgi:Fic family protein